MNDCRHEGDGPPDGVGFDVEHTDQSNPDEAEEQASGEHGDHDGASGSRRKRKHRRVTTEPVPGSDPTPQPEPPRHSGGENDDRLKADKPPHWGCI